jgi:exonuclease SbcC
VEEWATAYGTPCSRLVAVVSHLRAVAERIENVLYIKRREGDRSSEANWIEPAERDAIVEQEMERGLLA